MTSNLVGACIIGLKQGGPGYITKLNGECWINMETGVEKCCCKRGSITCAPIQDQNQYSNKFWTSKLPFLYNRQLNPDVIPPFLFSRPWNPNIIPPFSNNRQLIPDSFSNNRPWNQDVIPPYSNNIQWKQEKIQPFSSNRQWNPDVIPPFSTNQQWNPNVLQPFSSNSQWNPDYGIQM